MRFVLSAFFFTMVTASALAQAPDGGAVFARECAGCHVNPSGDSRAPTREALRQFCPDAIVTALTTGAMRLQGEKLSEAERRAVAEFLTSQAASVTPTVIAVGRCAAPASAVGDSSRGPRWNGWGAGASNG